MRGPCQPELRSAKALARRWEPYPVAMDEYRPLNRLARRALAGVPTTVSMHPDGRVVKRDVGHEARERAPGAATRGERTGGSHKGLGRAWARVPIRHGNLVLPGTTLGRDRNARMRRETSRGVPRITGRTGHVTRTFPVTVV